MMAKIECPIVIDGLEFVKDVIKRFVEEAEFADDVSEDYKNGFYDFGNSIVEALDNMMVRKAMGDDYSSPPGSSSNSSSPDM